MPRDASGNYSLPAGNPVIPGTTITSDWANSTMSDIANEITNSLDRSGRGGMLAPILFADGTVGEPSFTYTNEPTMGLYRKGPAQMAYVALGAERVVFSNTLTAITTNATIAGTLGVTGATTVNALTVNGALTASNIAITGGTMSGVAISGGSINNTPIGATTRAAGNFTTLNANGGGALTGTWSNLGSVTTIDINGGTIDGTAIGATARSTGAFTTLAANGATTLTSTLTVSGNTTLNGTVGGTGMNAFARLANNETVTGNWTFSNPINADITGNAATATSAGSATTADNALALGGFAANTYPRKAENATITGTWVFNNTISGSISGNAATATTATTATNATQLGGIAAANYPRINANATITATWTFNNNVTVPLVPTANGHATSKKYVDDLVAGGFDPTSDQNITGNWSFTQPIVSTVASGTAPFTIASNTLVTNLNADRVDNLQGSQFLRSDAADTATGVITFSAAPVFSAGFSTGSTAVVTNLNADRVDNIHAASFLRSDTTDTASGVITFTAVPIHPNGSAAAPGVRLTTEANMGMFRAGANILGFSTAGGERMRLQSGLMTVTGRVACSAPVNAGDAATKAYVDGLAGGGDLKLLGQYYIDSVTGTLGTAYTLTDFLDVTVTKANPKLVAIVSAQGSVGASSLGTYGFIQVTATPAPTVALVGFASQHTFGAATAAVGANFNGTTTIFNVGTFTVAAGGNVRIELRAAASAVSGSNGGVQIARRTIVVYEVV